MTRVEELRRVMSRDGGWREWSYIDHEIRDLFAVSLEDILTTYENEHQEDILAAEARRICSEDNKD